MNKTQETLINEELISEKAINQLIADANRCPSGDNAQPWKFNWNGKRLRIYHVESTAKHSLNRNNHASMIAFGALLQALKISASNQGLVPKISILVPDKNHLSAWADVSFNKTKTMTDPLYPMIAKRCTDRRPYQGGEINGELLVKMQNLNKQFMFCKMHINTKQSKAFMKYFLKTEEVLWKNKGIVKDLAKWFRLSKADIQNSQDGMNWKNMGMTYLESLVFRLVRRFPALPKFLWFLGFGTGIKNNSKKAIESSAALVCFSVKSVNAESLRELGELSYRTWLLLNAYGFGVQPLSFSSASVADAEAGLVKENIFSSGKSIFQENFSMRADEIPAWMFRTGVSTELPQEARAPRRNSKDMILVMATRSRIPVLLTSKSQDNIKIKIVNVSNMGLGIETTKGVFNNQEPFTIEVDLQSGEIINLLVKNVWHESQALIATSTEATKGGLQIVIASPQWEKFVTTLGH